MIIVRIKDSIVDSCIVLNDMSLLPLFSEGFDQCVVLENDDNNRPGVGYSYDGENFSPPNQE